MGFNSGFKGLSEESQCEVVSDYRSKRETRITLPNFGWKPSKEEIILRKSRQIFDSWSYNNTFYYEGF